MTAAPSAPGSLGAPAAPQDLLRYLDALDGWSAARSSELETIDEAIRTGGQSGPGTADLALSLALLKAVQDRTQLLRATWDRGGLQRADLERMTSLIWGRLDATLDPSLLARASTRQNGLVSGLAVSLPEACRLSDALAAQLRRTLGLDTDSDAARARLRTLRATVERIRDQVALEPPISVDQSRRHFLELDQRLTDLDQRLDRGADIGGLIGSLEIDAVTFERDLIVGSAKRREARGLVERARDLRRDLDDREAGLHALVERAVAEVTPTPVYAVPDVDALGPVPNTPDALGGYLAQLERVSRAMQVVQHAYSESLAAVEAARRDLAAQRGRLGSEPPAVVAALDSLIEGVLAERPVPTAVLAPLLGAHRQIVDLAASGVPIAGRPAEVSR